MRKFILAFLVSILTAGPLFGAGAFPIFVASTQTQGNFTTFVPTSPSGSGLGCSVTGTCIQYISSSSGTDQAGCGTYASPCATPEYVMANGGLRNGHPDWMLLRQGDTWTDNGWLNKSNGANYFESIKGPSTNSPGFPPYSGSTVPNCMLIGSYFPGAYTGGQNTNAQPKLQYDSSYLYSTVANFIYGHDSTGGPDNLCIVGLNFYGYTRDPNSTSATPSEVNYTAPPSIDLSNAFTFLLLEDNSMSYLGEMNADPEDAGSGSWLGNNLVMYRNRVSYAYVANTNDKVSNILMDGVLGSGYYENIYAGGGWLQQLNQPNSVTVNSPSGYVTWTNSHRWLQNGNTVSFTVSTCNIVAGTSYPVTNAAGGGTDTFQLTGVTISGTCAAEQVQWLDVGPTAFNRDFYLSSVLNGSNQSYMSTTFKRNMSLYSSSESWEARAGTTVWDSLSFAAGSGLTPGSSANAFVVGCDGGTGCDGPLATPAAVQNNVAIYSTGGVALIGNISGSIFSGNLIANAYNDTDYSGVGWLDVGVSGGPDSAVTGSGNYVWWPTTSFTIENGSTASFTGNSLTAGQLLVNSSADLIAQYSLSIGGAGTDADFETKSLAQRSGGGWDPVNQVWIASDGISWNPNYTANAVNNWVRGKAGMASVPALP